jgi:hypothetical protein
MEALINKDIPAFHMRANALHEAALAALKAIDAKERPKLFEVGEQIDQACENCHKQYWYPNEKIPPCRARPRRRAEGGAAGSRKEDSST